MKYVKVAMYNPKRRVGKNADAPPYMKRRTVRRLRTTQAWKEQFSALGMMQTDGKKK